MRPSDLRIDSVQDRLHATRARLAIVRAILHRLTSDIDQILTFDDSDILSTQNSQHGSPADPSVSTPALPSPPRPAFPPSPPPPRSLKDLFSGGFTVPLANELPLLLSMPNQTSSHMVSNAPAPAPSPSRLVPATQRIPSPKCNGLAVMSTKTSSQNNGNRSHDTQSFSNNPLSLQNSTPRRPVRSARSDTTSTMSPSGPCLKNTGHSAPTTNSSPPCLHFSASRLYSPSPPQHSPANTISVMSNRGLACNASGSPLVSSNTPSIDHDINPLTCGSSALTDLDLDLSLLETSIRNKIITDQDRESKLAPSTQGDNSNGNSSRALLEELVPPATEQISPVPPHPHVDHALSSIPHPIFTSNIDNNNRSNNHGAHSRKLQDDNTVMFRMSPSPSQRRNQARLAQHQLTHTEPNLAIIGQDNTVPTIRHLQRKPPVPKAPRRAQPIRQDGNDNVRRERTNESVTSNDKTVGEKKDGQPFDLLGPAHGTVEPPTSPVTDVPKTQSSNEVIASVTAISNVTGPSNPDEPSEPPKAPMQLSDLHVIGDSMITTHQQQTTQENSGTSLLPRTTASIHRTKTVSNYNPYSRQSMLQKTTGAHNSATTGSSPSSTGYRHTHARSKQFSTKLTHSSPTLKRRNGPNSEALATMPSIEVNKPRDLPRTKQNESSSQLRKFVAERRSEIRRQSVDTPKESLRHTANSHQLYNSSNARKIDGFLERSVDAEIVGSIEGQMAPTVLLQHPKQDEPNTTISGNTVNPRYEGEEMNESKSSSTWVVDASRKHRKCQSPLPRTQSLGHRNNNTNTSCDQQHVKIFSPLKQQDHQRSGQAIDLGINPGGEVDHVKDAEGNGNMRILPMKQGRVDLVVDELRMTWTINNIDGNQLT